MRRECSVDPDVLIMNLFKCQLLIRSKEMEYWKQMRTIACIQRVFHMDSRFQKWILWAGGSVCCEPVLCLFLSSKHDSSLKGQPGTDSVWLHSTGNIINMLLSLSHSFWWMTLQIFLFKLNPLKIYLDYKISNIKGIVHPKNSHSLMHLFLLLNMERYFEWKVTCWLLVPIGSLVVQCMGVNINVMKVSRVPKLFLTFFNCVQLKNETHTILE